jgi:hypothetical protein
LSKPSNRKPPKKRAKKRRHRFATPAQTRANYQSIAKRQKRFQKQKRRFRRAQGSSGETFTPEIIENIEKSERAWENDLRKITRAEDLDAFED